MEVKPLGESPEVIHLFESMEQNRLYVEKSQMEEIVAHMDELLTSIKQIEKELADMRSLTGNAFTSIVDEGSTAVAEAKSVVQRAKYKIRDISGRAAALGGNALISALHAAHIPNLLEKVQSVLHDTELRMRKSAHKAEAISEELHAANVHIANIERIMGGKDIPQNLPAERKGPLTVMRAGFLGLANTFERLSGATAKLREKIPDLDRASAKDRESVRGRIQDLKQQSAPGKARQTEEVEI